MDVEFLVQRPNRAIRHRPLVCALVAALLALAPTGCAKRALYSPNGRGGFTLQATTDSIDDAMSRFKQTARDICAERSFELTPPTVVDQGARPTTYRTDMVCVAP